MNTLTTLSNEYLRSDKSIDTVLVSNGHSNRIFYIYNYQGYSFKVFDSLIMLMEFFQDKFETVVHFEREEEVDAFLQEVVI